ncbi:unnamed protein product [[Candida] boidinii]|uniref:Unnamed protein product n=1 Tax=Candida boidinii TaxID=5477 RepID=A0ACB5U426_CANBO|nr:unnamed protein product [[Candida] boidinii]
MILQRKQQMKMKQKKNRNLVNRSKKPIKDSTESPKASTSFTEKQNVIFIQEFPSDVTAAATATAATEDRKPISQISKPVVESNGEAKDTKHDGDSTIESSPVEINQNDIEVKEDVKIEQIEESLEESIAKPKEEDSKSNNFDILNVNPDEGYSSDDMNLDDASGDDEADSSESSDSDSDSDSDSGDFESDSDSDDSDSDSDDDSNSISKDQDIEDEVNEDEGDNGPIRSTNEAVNEEAPELPEDYKIDLNTPLEYIGDITGLVEKSVLIKAASSGEFRVLKENSVLCFEDRTPLGPLFETFGKIESPVYRVKFNTLEKFNKLKDKKGFKKWKLKELKSNREIRKN